MNEIPKYLCAFNIDNEERNQSTSGAIFPLLAKQIIKNRGVVCGVAYDENMQVRHMFAENEDDLNKFKGSKYVYSNLGSSFSKIKQYLANGKEVLFTGNPCQIASLKKYLNGVNQDNLYLMDIVCHSTANPKIFKRYVEYLEKKYNKKVININFRDKTKGWHNSHPTVYFEDGSSVIDTVFFYAFSFSAITNPMCFQCTYYDINRVSDITIGDFWGVEKILPEMDDNKGTSLVIISTKKGLNLFNKIQENVKFMAIKKEDALKYNHHQPAQKHKNYDKIQKMINEDNFIEYLEKAIKKTFFEKLKTKIIRTLKK